MLRFNREKFYAGYRTQFGKITPLTQQRVDGINSILDSMEKDPFLVLVEHAAYMFATVKPETAHTFQPIHEYGSHKYFVNRYGGQTKLGKRLGNDTPEEGALYAGVGNVQLTGEDNFERAEAALRREYPAIVAEFEKRTGKKFDLTVGDQPGDRLDPQNAGDPAIAYAIMSYGMRTGMFTGRKLSDYNKVAGFDAYNARDIINGDKKKHGRMIEGYYKQFLTILKAALIRSNSAAAAPLPVVDQLDETAHDPDPTSPTPDGQAAPDVESTQTPNSSTDDSVNVEQNAETIINEGSLIDKAGEAGDKFQYGQGVLDKFGFSVADAKRSIGTVLLTWGKALFAMIMTALGVFLNHWELFVIAGLLLILAYLIWDRSGKRVAEAKAGVPVEVAKEMLK